MFRCTPTRTSDGYFALHLEVPKTVPADRSQIPRIKLAFDHYGLRGTQRDHSELPNCLTNIGIFIDDPKIPDGRQPQALCPFEPGHLRNILLGDYDDEWVLYGFEVQAYALALYYYNILQPERQGVIEFGCNFSTLQFQLAVPAQGHSAEPEDIVSALSLETPTVQRAPGARFNYTVFLWRNPTKTQSIFKIRRRHYVECSATIVRSIKTVSGSVSRRVELSGEDTLFVEAG